MKLCSPERSSSMVSTVPATNDGARHHATYAGHGGEGTGVLHGIADVAQIVHSLVVQADGLVVGANRPDTCHQVRIIQDCGGLCNTKFDPGQLESRMGAGTNV